MMAYRSLIHSVKKHSTVCGVLGFPLLLFKNCIYSTSQTVKNATPGDYVFTLRPKLQERHQLMRDFIDVD